MHQSGVLSRSEGKSDKSFLAVLLMTTFVGFLGLHRIYVGKVGTGLLFLVTGGFFGIGWFVDFLTVIFGQFTDKDMMRVRW